MAEKDKQPSPPPEGSFEERLARARGGEKKTEEQERAAPSPIGIAFRLSVEMVAGLVAGGIIGWLLDRLFGTAPLLMIVFFFLGAGAGIRSAIRAAREMQEEAEKSETGGRPER